MKMKNPAANMCNPTFVYLILSFMTFIFLISMNSGILSILFFVIKVLIWVFILNFLCNNKMEFLAWFFVLLPFIIMFFMIMYYTAVISAVNSIVVVTTN